MKRAGYLLTSMALLCIAGCSKPDIGLPKGYIFGYSTLIGTLHSVPGPSSSITRPKVEPGTAPKIVIDASIADYNTYYYGDRWYNNGRVAATLYGRVFNVDPKKTAVVLYSGHYIQPHIGAYITIQRDGTWFSPSHDAVVTAFLVKDTYQITLGEIPKVDGVYVLASTTNASDAP